MANDLNVVALNGRLGQDPEIRYSPEGTAIASMSLAVGRQWKKDGQKHESVQYFPLEAFGPLVEHVIKPYVKKGTQISLTGELVMKQWEDKQTNSKRRQMVVRVSFLQLLTSPKEKQGETREQQPTPRQPAPDFGDFMGDGMPF